MKGRIFITTLNVRDAIAVAEWVTSCFEKEGRLNGSANCAGVNGVNTATTILDTTPTDWDFIIGVNLTGVANCMRAQLRYMTRPGGSIVNISSTLGLFGQPYFGAYSASKHGVNGLTKSSAAEFGREGIRINSICPYVHVLRSDLGVQLPLRSFVIVKRREW
jgi:NAD(P)-dependent dehydrogenase (short-subunit alcohol dehydrogenase family)